jgi:hypothetical protein
MDRYAAWNKIIACIDALPLYDWIFYIDVDCIIMNHSKMLENLFRIWFDHDRCLKLLKQSQRKFFA